MNSLCEGETSKMGLAVWLFGCLAVWMFAVLQCRLKKTSLYLCLFFVVTLKSLIVN